MAQSKDNKCPLNSEIYKPKYIYIQIYIKKEEGSFLDRDYETKVIASAVRSEMAESNLYGY